MKYRGVMKNNNNVYKQAKEYLIELLAEEALEYPDDISRKEKNR
jgi:hypothetical protein